MLLGISGVFRVLLKKRGSAIRQAHLAYPSGNANGGTFTAGKESEDLRRLDKNS